MRLIQESFINNPFSACTARDMSYEDVCTFWCDPFDLYSLNLKELTTSVTPIVIEGARGTGKTMILKYLSYWGQIEMNGSSSFSDKISQIQNYNVGIYFRYKSDICFFLSDIVNEHVKRIVFNAYFSAYLSREVLCVLRDLFSEFKKETEVICDIIEDVFGRKPNDLDDSKSIINSIIESFDEKINDYVAEEELRHLFSKYNDSHLKLISLASERLPQLNGVIFLILLDEYENSGEFQKEINTMIRKKDSTIPISYRIGMRPGGMKSNHSEISNENIQPNRDYLLCTLKFKRVDALYKRFIKEVCKKRLNQYEEFVGNDDIESILGIKESYEDEAKWIVGDSDHFWTTAKAMLPSWDEKSIELVRKDLSSDDILLETYNILLVSRGNNPSEIGMICQAYRDGLLETNLEELEQKGVDRKSIHRYYDGYRNKYRFSLLYILCRIYKKKKHYYSFNTFVYLSSGAVNDFVALCRHVFNQLDKSDLEETLFKNISVDWEIQSLAAENAATEQLRKLSSHQFFGKEILSFVDNLGSIFEEYSRDLSVRYPETNQFAFEDEIGIYTSGIEKYIVELINCGAIIKKDNRQRISVGKSKGVLYILNRMFAPYYQYSYRTRGGHNLVISTDSFIEFLNKKIQTPEMYVGRIPRIIDKESKQMRIDFK